MVKLIKLNLSYLFNKNNIVLISIMLSVYTLLTFILSRFYINKNDQLLYCEIYKYEYESLIFTTIKLIVNLTSVYIFSIIKNINYFMLLKTTKLKFYTSKILSNIIVITFVLFAFYLIYCVVGLTFTKWFYFDIIDVKRLLVIWVQSLLFGLLTQIISFVFKGGFEFIIIYLIFIISENLDNYDVVYQIINIFMIFNISSLYDIIRIILIASFYYIMGFIVFLKYENY